jgi:hypothetical protein
MRDFRICEVGLEMLEFHNFEISDFTILRRPPYLKFMRIVVKTLIGVPG